MKKITIFLLIVSFLSLVSFIFLEDIFSPLKLLFFLLLSSIVGMPMALEYPWSYEVHQTIVIFSTLALAIMIYGIFRRKSRLGKVLFLLGFLLWSGIGLFFGLSTGT